MLHPFLHIAAQTKGDTPLFNPANTPIIAGPPVRFGAKLPRPRTWAQTSFIRADYPSLF